MIFTVPIDKVLTFLNSGSYVALFDTGDQNSVTSLQASLTVTDVEGGSANYTVYAARGDGAGGPSYCVDVNSFGGPTTWPASGPCTSITGANRYSIVCYPGSSPAYPRHLHVEGSVTADYDPLVIAGGDLGGGCCHDPMLDEILACVRTTFPST